MIAGVDPGPRTTALVVLDGDHRDWVVLAAHTWTPDLSCDGLRHLVERVDDLIATALYEASRGPVRIFVEDVNPPTPHIRGIAVGYLFGTARIIGALATLRPTPRLVPPAKFGTGPLAAYPPQLVGPRERTGGGKSRWQHLRAAYDCALAGEAALRLERMGAGR